MTLPTSTDVTVQLREDAPAAADAVAVLVHKASGGAPPSLPSGLPREVADVVRSMQAAGVVTGKSNELCTQLLDGRKGQRLLVAPSMVLTVIGCQNGSVRLDVQAASDGTAPSAGINTAFTSGTQTV